jgi:hypothetical protein
MKWSLFLAALAPNAALASDWQTVSTNSEAVLQIDRSSVTSDYENSGTVVWIKYKYNRIQPNGSSYTIEHWEVQCSSHAIRITSTNAFHANGLLIKSSGHIDSDFEDVIPDSTGQTVEDAVCPGANQ